MTKFIDGHRGEFPVESMCKVLEFPSSTYYAAKKRDGDPPGRSLRDRELLVEIRRVTCSIALRHRR